jgi:hypothetical protein
VCWGRQSPAAWRGNALPLVRTDCDAECRPSAIRCGCLAEGSGSHIVLTGPKPGSYHHNGHELLRGALLASPLSGEFHRRSTGTPFGSMSLSPEAIAVASESRARTDARNNPVPRWRHIGQHRPSAAPISHAEISGDHRAGRRKAAGSGRDLRGHGYLGSAPSGRTPLSNAA